MGVRVRSSESPEMYLKSMLQLGADDGPVAISTLAENLGISPVSATEMVHRMVGERLVEHIPYKGVSLTEIGKQRALAVLRRHRLWERFLTDRLGLPWDQVHEAACQLEHSVGPEVTEPLAEDLGQPDTCPHGNPIPSVEGNMPSAPGLKLHELRVGQRGVVDVIRPEKADILEYLRTRGITPGAELEILEVEPLDGARMILIGSQRVAVGRELAEYVRIRPVALSPDEIPQD